MHKSESMGKKATFYLLNNLLIAATCGFLLLAAACWYAPRVDPCIRPGWWLLLFRAAWPASG